MIPEVIKNEVYVDFNDFTERPTQIWKQSQRRVWSVREKQICGLNAEQSSHLASLG